MAKTLHALPYPASWNRLAAALVGSRVARFLRRAPRPTAAAARPADLASQPNGRRSPVQPDAAWPLFRHDGRNTGRSPLRGDYHGDQPWAFRTGKGIFSTPVIDAAGDIYVGSADHAFYALRPDGSLKWRVVTGEIIDSAAALPRPGLAAAEPSVIFPSGDGFLYHVRTSDGSLLWRFDAAVAPRASYNNWWEGNVALGCDGTIYAGNTNFNYYAITPDGQLKWTYATAANNWSIAGLGDDGALFWGSNDTFVRRVDPAGREQWRKRTLGFIAASAAIGSDGTVYIGSFDSYFYALDGRTGRVRWKFKTGDHIYSSAALAEDADGRTTAIYFGSTDGVFYALDPAGRLLWSYQVGDPIRSSPALGAAPMGEAGGIVYFGAGNGRLYALNAADGTRRWSFDTTSADPELADRNDLNGSPALGRTGVYIGSETGDLWYVPYDYCRHVADPRGSAESGEDLPADATGVYYVTPGGSTVFSGQPTVPTAAIITLRLIVRRAGRTVDGRVCNRPVGCPADALTVTTEPAFPFKLEKSADGHYLHIIPEGFLPPDTAFTVRARGIYYTGGPALGNLHLGGRAAGRFDASVTLRTVAASAERLPLTIGQESVTALEWTRLALPIPPMLPSLNQIGFDYMDWIMAPVYLTEPDAHGEGRVILWATGAMRNEAGALVVDPASDFALPLAGCTRGEAFILENRNFTMKVTGIPIPFHLLQMRGELGSDGRVRPGAALYADTDALAIPTFGPYLVIAGLANDWYKKLLVTGTYVTRPYNAGPANRRPIGLSVADVDFTPSPEPRGLLPTRRQPGRVTAAFAIAPGAAYPLAQHRPAILLVDALRGEPVTLDYHANLAATADADGNLAAVTLTIPPGTRLPKELTAVVIADAFPLERGFMLQATSGRSPRASPDGARA
ncbi:MAG: PQQ-binding-like beta-propeller repeat protein [Chloroflexi bacterium]|nr:PQQ-binding-like beta-propeller repeat protein [Chloroflexota bacterium]